MVILKKETKLQTALSAAHRDHEHGLNVHAFLKLNDRGISEGLVQDTFMKTWSYLVKGGKIQLMKAFLYHTLNCLIVDEYRKRKTTSLEVLIEKGYEPNTGHAKSLFDCLDGQAVLLLIERLPKTYQKVMHMRYVQDMPIKEIALTIGQTKNNVTVQLHRGLEKLKLLYGPISKPTIV